MAEPCGCEESLELRAQNERLREYGRGIIEAGGDVARERDDLKAERNRLEAVVVRVTDERDALKAENAALRELAGELWKYQADWVDNFAAFVEFKAFVAKAKSLGGGGEMSYPEHEKLKAIKDKSQTVGQFLADLGEMGLVLAVWDERDDLRMANESIDSILARYFEIDRDALEREKLAMLDECRALTVGAK